ncbi:MAG: D-alanyl-D-alanine carboxypeptidase/D-alanyl-D-alanine-endopeptidase [bacterium]
MARFVTILATLSVSAVVLAASSASAAPVNPDRAFRTLPVRQTLDAGSSSSISPAILRKKLGKLIRRFGESAGAWIAPAQGGKAIFVDDAGRAFPMASVTNLFTTGTALTRLGSASTREPTVWSRTEPIDGVAVGGIVLVGDGDPTLAGSGIAKLAKRIATAGIERVQGPVFYDASNFDLRTTVPQTGVTGGPYLGSLSGLSYGWGWGDSGPVSNPAGTAASELARTLRARGVVVSGTVKRAPEGLQRAEQVARLESPAMSSIAAATNAPSDNFLAEMTLKILSDQLGPLGTTKAGVRIVERFAAANDARISIENGSGLSRRNRATPAAVGRFLRSMAGEPPAVASAFRDSLAVAGRTGTLAYRMKGTAAEERCQAKTGTLNGVSALSGYCRTASSESVAFSLLFGGRVDTDAARTAQDKVAALIASLRL